MTNDLKQPGAILLISCYELGHQPLSIASPLALLREAGYSPAVLDLAVQRLDPDLVGRARFAAIAVPMHTALRLGARVAQRIRALSPGCHLCLYGLYASLNATTLLARGADSIIGGEFEEPLVRLVRSLDAGHRGDDGKRGDAGDTARPEGAPPAPLPGVPTAGDRLAGIRIAGVRTAGAAEPPWIDRIRFAVPWRDPLPPLDRYARLEEDGRSRAAGHVEASRGCLHHCRHCPIPPVYGGRFFVVPREVVLADIRNQAAAGATHITFGDPDFLNGPGHSLALARAMHAELPALTFDFTAKIEHLLRHRGLLAELRSLGCLFIVSAVESLSDRVLAILAKGHTRADVEEALRLTRDAGLALRPSFVPFTPWSGLEDYRALLGFIENRDLVDSLDPVQLSIRLLLPPGSLLLDRPETAPFLGPLDPDRFTYVWTHPDPRMDALQLAVSALVERAARAGEDPLLTFHRMEAAAQAAETGAHPPIGSPTAGSAREEPARLPSAGVLAAMRRDKSRPPRLSEPWFC